MIPAQGLQTVQLRGRGESRDELRQTLLIFRRKNKPRAQGMLAGERFRGKDADAAGLVDAEQDAPVYRSPRRGLELSSISWRICSSTAAEQSIRKGHCGIRQVLRFAPGPVGVDSIRS